jgi:hypothetical protein
MTRDYWGLGNSIPVTTDLPRETSPKLKQKVCRTKSTYTASVKNLQVLLDEGWKVVLATPTGDGIIEYILEKYV